MYMNVCMYYSTKSIEIVNIPNTLGDNKLWQDFIL